MMKPFTYLLLAALLAVLPARGQEQIDRLINKTSAVDGRIKFTSVVERNPQTGRVRRVTKSLQNVRGDRYAAFERAFEQAAKGKGLERRVNDNRAANRSITLLFVLPGQRRTYMLADNRRTNNTFNVYCIVNIESEK